MVRVRRVLGVGHAQVNVPAGRAQLLVLLGGRDRDAIVDHVREAERSYGRKLGPRVPPRTPWPDQRKAYVDALLAGAAPDPRWPIRYWLRRTAWHVLDHAREIEDRSEGRRA